MASGYLPVAGTGVCLPAARDVAELGACLLAARPLVGSRRRFSAEHTDLPPVDVPVGLCGDPHPPASRPVRLAGLPRESQLAACAAASALAPAGDLRGGQVGVVWVSSTAGLAEYGQICVEAATLAPGHASPLTAPQSGYNGPAAAVSIRLDLTGPHLTLTGGCEAGATALVEAYRLLDEGRCRYVLVGGSAAVSRWRLAGADPRMVPQTVPEMVPQTVPAEGALCLLLGPRSGPVPPAGRGRWSAPGSVGGARPLCRSRLRGPDGPAAVAEFVAGCLRRMDGPPDAVAVSAAAPWYRSVERAVKACGVPWWWMERISGEVGAAGGLQAVLAAIAWCGAAGSGGSRVLALAVGAAGDAVAVEVVSCGMGSHGREHRHEPL